MDWKDWQKNAVWPWGCLSTKGSWSLLEGRPDFISALSGLKHGLQQVHEVLELASSHGDQLENCYQRSQVIIDRLASLDSS